MIYQVKDNKKIPLGTQFDNSWEIEYDRDLSSQLSGKSEWTATEDCWFQWTYVWTGPNSDSDIIAQLNNLKVTVNGVPVQTRGGVTSRGELEVSSITYNVNVLLKKGDVIAITCSHAGSDVFKDTSVRCFPIHRILSNREGERDRSYAIWNTERNVDYWLIADKPQGVVHVSFLANNQQMEIIWNVATAETRQMGPTGGDAIFRGMEDPVYGRPYLMVRTTENIGSYFIDTVDCVLTVERRPH